MSGAAKEPSFCDIWMWDGSVEYEGALCHVGDGDFSAHMRETKKGETKTLRGQRIAVSFVDLQSHFTGHKFLACFRKPGEGDLLEVGILSVQRSSVSDFSFLVCGRYRTLDPGQQEVLRKLSVQSAAALLGS